MWIIFVIVIVGYIIYQISKDYNRNVKTGVTQFGGMLNKYKTVIDFFVESLPAKITKVTNDKVVLTASTTTVYFDYVGHNLEIEVRGFAPLIGNYSKKWKYPDGYPQETMIKEIENYYDWQMQNFTNLAGKDYGQYLNYD